MIERQTYRAASSGVALVFVTFYHLPLVVCQKMLYFCSEIQGEPCFIIKQSKPLKHGST